jgi:DNA mismatch repair protein MutS2
MIVDRAALERLEWPSLQQLLASLPRTSMAQARAAALLPIDDVGVLDRQQSQIEELRRVIAEHGRLPLRACTDPRPTLRVLQIQGRSLPALEIYQLVQLLGMGRELAQFVRRLDPETFPEWGAQWARFPDLEPVLGPIEGNITSSGELEDHASPELARIRREMRHNSERVERMLQGLLKADWTGPVLRDRYYTVRNRRFVVPIRTDTPHRFPGIVHGHSASDKTLFVEPLETIEINNELVRLAEDEQAEIDRILFAYSDLLRVFQTEIESTIELIGEFDFVEALGIWADEIGAVRPDFVEGGGLQLEQARHPLLERALLESGSGRKIVPLQVDLPRETRALVISGPNAGGKTVALKTIGLLTLMAHAGLPVPAQQARIPLFTGLFVDVGDEQSIRESLSTFSSHVRNLAHMVRHAQAGGLALIDEIGTGTDPAEGAALGLAVMERLMKSGARIVVTTHHAAVKSWGYRTAGALNAACDFDERTLRPTFRLVSGVAGASIGLTMAAQFGMPEDVVDAAHRKLDPTGVEAARALDAVRSLASDLERQREETIALRRQYDAEDVARVEKWRRDEQQRRQQWQLRVEELARSFRREADKLLETLTDVKERREIERERAHRERLLRDHFSEEIRTTRRAEPAPDNWTPSPAQRVFVVSLGREGIVRRVENGRAEIQLGRAQFSLKLQDLRPITSESNESPVAEAPTTFVRRAPVLPSGVTGRISDRVVPRELNLIGKRVDEALELLARYVDDAILGELKELRIVHGFGTGALKRAVREWLQAHPEILKWHDADPDHGGGGATIVELRSE